MIVPKAAGTEGIWGPQPRGYTSPRARLRDRPLPTERGTGAIIQAFIPDDPCPVCDGCGDDGINGIGHSCHVCGGSGVRVPDKGATDD